MDRDRRYNLRSVVGKSRRIIEDDIAKKLIYYGITKKADPIPAENLQHLSEEDKEIKIKLEKAIEKEKCAVTNYQKAVDRYIRHVGFTFINRIAALRAMEVRGLITETILRKSEYGGMSLRERGIHEQNHELTPDQVLEESLKKAFREVTKEIKVLFDLESEYSIVFPSSKALRDIIQLLSDDVNQDDWMQDDIIGWIYQYYNEDARQEFKKSKRSPTADDIPVINQFYTPHWVVRILTDNTLGRLWLEQKGRCPYFLEHDEYNELIDKRTDIPNKSDEENFKAWLKSRKGKKVDNFCTYLVPQVNKPSERINKGAREIKVLDPACGSGHFLIYAFDVLYRIYLEDEPDTPEKEIPGLILENNLFGIDIDLRAVQLAALSLYLKAKSYNPSIAITKMNLVCADSHIAPGKKRNEFLNRFDDSLALKEIFAKTFENLNNTNELGSLLKVRKPFEVLLENVYQSRFSIDADKSMGFPKIRTIDGMLQELKDFEHESMEKQDMGSLLFATEAEKSVGLLSILSQKYDIILMNPPYGKMPKETKNYLKANYPLTHHDLYAAFIEQAIELSDDNQLVGMITSRTFMLTKRFQKLREDILTNSAKPELVVDTGFDVLDGATVETVLTCLRKNSKTGFKEKNETLKKFCSFNRLISYPSDLKEKIFKDSLYDKFNLNSDSWYDLKIKEFEKMPGFEYSYWTSDNIRSLFEIYTPLDSDKVKKKKAKKIADIKQGLQTGDNTRFTRYFWELTTNDELYMKKIWLPYNMGGGHKKFYSDIDLVIYWNGDGKFYRDRTTQFCCLITKNRDKYLYKPGLTWTQKPAGKTKPFIAMRLFPGNSIFSVSGPLCILEEKYKFIILSIGVSKLCYYLSSLRSSEHLWTEGVIGSLPISKDALMSDKLNMFSKEAHDLLKEYDTINENSTIFIKPLILQVLHGHDHSDKPITGHPFADQFSWSDWESSKEIRSVSNKNGISIKHLNHLCSIRENMLKERLKLLENLIDKEVFRVYHISDEDKSLIENEIDIRTGRTGGSESKSNSKNNESDIKNSMFVKSLISYYAKLSIEEDEDGIVPISQLSDDIRKKLAEEFGEEIFARIESEIYEFLGKSVKDWLSQDYFDYHIDLYKRRPIYWQFTSARLAKGRVKMPGNFTCFVNYHKLNRDIIPKMISFYLKSKIESAIRERDRIKKDLEKMRIKGDRKKVNKRSKEYEQAANNVEELESFEQTLNEIHNPREDKTKLPKKQNWVQEKIKEIRDDGWNPVIDYGVRVNIEPLKEAQILPRSADRVK